MAQLLYPAYMYSAHVAVARLRLPPSCACFAQGLMVVLLDVP